MANTTPLPRTLDPIRCRYVDCVERHPIIAEEYFGSAGTCEGVTCERCRMDMGLDPITVRPKTIYPLQRATEVTPMESEKEIYLVGSSSGHPRPCVLRASPNRVPVRKSDGQNGYKDGYKDDAIEIMKFFRNHLPSGTVEEFVVLLVKHVSYQSLIARTLKEENRK